MMYCEKCGIHLAGSISRCPLCQSSLSGEPEEGAFPVLAGEKKAHGLILRLAALTTVVVLVICAAVNLSLPESGSWFWFVAAGLVSLWLLLGVAAWKRRNPLKSIVWLLAVVSALVLLWDWRTGFAGWSVNFVLPIFISCTQFAVAAVAITLRLLPSEYLLYLILCILAGLLPLISLFCGVLQVVYPSVICGGISAIFLAVLLLFRGAPLKDEILRRLHL